VTVVIHDRQRRAGAPAGSFASEAGRAILVAMTATLSSATFVGRTEELARLAAAADRAAAGTPTAVVVGGEAGVGKTRLVGELVASARQAGATVLVGGCVELGGEGLPFAPLIEALRGFVRDLDEPELAQLVPGRTRVELARLLPELGPGGPGSAGAADGGLWTAGSTRSPGPVGSPTGGPGAGLGSEQGRLFELLLVLLERLGSERPAVLMVEDLHWADRSTRDLLAFLVRNLRHGRLLLVMTYRSDELHRRHPLRPFLAELDRGRRAERLELARFGRDEVAAQLAGILGAPAPPELTERIHARSDGNAFFVEELAATAAAGADGELPPSLRDTLLARIELLAEPTQQVLGTVAVGAAAVADPLLAEVAGLPDADLLVGLREAVSAHVLLVDAGDGTYGFRHALVKEAVYAELLPGERTRLHARFATALAGRDAVGDPGPAAELAWHWYAAHDLERALPAAVEAGRAAERAYAYAEAQRQFERALELWDRVPGATAGLDKAELLARAGEAAANAGAADRAVALVRGALAEVTPGRDPLLAGQLTERLGFHLRIAGRPGAMEAYQEAIGLVPPGPTVERARVLAGLGQALMLRARFAEAIATCEEAIRVARAAGSPAVETHALCSLGTAMARIEDPDDGLAALGEARRLAAELGLAKDEARACVNLSDLLNDLGRLEEAVAVAMEGIEVASAAGLRRTFGVFLAGNAAAALYNQGRWDETAELTTAYLELATTRTSTRSPCASPWPCWTPAGGTSSPPSAMSGRPGGWPATSSSPCSTRPTWPRPRPRRRPGGAGWRRRRRPSPAAWPPSRARWSTCGRACCWPSGCGSRASGPGWPRPATTTRPWPTPGWSATSWCSGPGAPSPGRGWPGGGPCWPPARPSGPGSRASPTRSAGWPRWPPGRSPGTPTRWPWSAGGRPRRCWPGAATAPWPPSCCAAATPPPPALGPSRCGASWSGWPGWAGWTCAPRTRPARPPHRRPSRRTRPGPRSA